MWATGCGRRRAYRPHCAQTVSIAARQTAATARCHTERQPVRPHYFEFDACSSGRAAAPESGVIALASILRCQLGWGSAGSGRTGARWAGCRWYESGCGSQSGDLVPDGESSGHFGAMVVSGEPMAAGPEVRRDHAERPGTVGLRRAFSIGVPTGVIATSSWTPCWSRIEASGLIRPREDDDRYVVAACELRDTERCLALHGLGVDAAFSGEHPISARDGVFQTNRFGDDLDSGLGFCSQKLEQREPQPACGSGAGTGRLCMTECRGSHSCQLRQCRFQIVRRRRARRPFWVRRRRLPRWGRAEAR